MDPVQWLAVHVDPFERYIARRSPARVKGQPPRGSMSYPASAPLSHEGADHPASLQTAPLERPRMDPHERDEIEAEFFRAYRSILERHSDVLAAKAEELIAQGRTNMDTDHGAMEARLVRFWNGSGAIDLRYEGGSSISRISRRGLQSVAGLIVDNLAMALANAAAEPTTS
jgi:hypothetical protein